MSETLNGKEIYTTDEVLAAIAVYLRAASTATYDYHEGAEALYEDLVNMDVIKTFKDQVTDALKEDK